jgi:hypothetical protein
VAIGAGLPPEETQAVVEAASLLALPYPGEIGKEAVRQEMVAYSVGDEDHPIRT